MSGWPKATLEDVAIVGAGNSAPQDKRLFEDGTFPFIRTADVGRIRVGRLRDAQDKLNTGGIKGLRLHKAGTVLIPKSGASTFLDHRVVMEIDGYVSSHLATLRAKEGVIDPAFLFWATQTIVASEVASDSSYPTLSLEQIKAIPITLPPLDEQRRIVAVLDEAFAAIATATANAEKNLANARALLESSSQEIFANLEQDGVQLAALGGLTAPNSPITYGVVKPGPEGSVPFVRGGDLVDGEIRLDHLRTISNAFSDQYRRTLLRGGELLICLVGTPGECAIAPPQLAGANIARQVGLIRLHDGISPAFVRDFLLSGLGQKLLGLRTGGSVQQVINLVDLKLIEVPVPPLQRQLAIVSQLRVLKDSVKYLERLFEDKRIALAELKGALLATAFADELVRPERELVPA